MKSWYAAIGWLKDGSVLTLARESRENGLQVGRQTSHNVLDMRPQLNGKVVGQRQMIGLQERLLTPDTASLFHYIISIITQIIVNVIITIFTKLIIIIIIVVVVIYLVITQTRN